MQDDENPEYKYKWLVMRNNKNLVRPMDRF